MGITYAQAKAMVPQLYPNAKLERAFQGGKGGTPRWAIIGVRMVEMVKPDGTSFIAPGPTILGVGHSFEAMFADAARKKAVAEKRQKELAEQAEREQAKQAQAEEKSE